MSFIMIGCAELSDAPPGQVVERWSAELEVQIGAVDDSLYGLSAVRRLAVGQTGTMYTLHRQQQHVRVFAPDGTFERFIGGRGDGPADFKSVSEMGFVADTLWVLDLIGYRFKMFSEQGELIRSFEVPFVLGDTLSTYDPPRAAGLLWDGTVYGRPPSWARSVADGSITHRFTMTLAKDGTVVDSLPSVPIGRDLWAVVTSDLPVSGATYEQQPFADGPLWSLVPGERATLHLDREAPLDEGRASVRLTKLSFNGDTLFTRELAFASIPVTREEVDSVLQARVALVVEHAPGFAEGRARRLAEETLYRPAFRPPVRSMVVGERGRIWLREARPERESRTATWLVLDASGRPLARVDLPAGFTLMWARGSRIWGTRNDELDVPYLLRYRVQRSSSAAVSSN